MAPADQLTAKPAAISWEWRARCSLPRWMAACASVEAVAPQAGETVVVSAGAAGVGSIAVQLARRTGARVIGLAGEHNHEWLRRHDIVPVSYGEGQPSGLATRPTAGSPPQRSWWRPEASKIPIARTFPLDQVRTAYEELGARHTNSKIVLVPWTR